MKIPAYSPTIRRKEMDAVLTCMVSEKIGPGEMNQRLIQLVKETLNADGAVAFRSPAIALRAAFDALALEPGSGIVLSALAPLWQLRAVEQCGFTPIIADVDPNTAMVTAETVEVALKQGGRVLVLHETLGFMPDMESIVALGIPVIEDISQSIGASFREQSAGSFGVFSILGLEEQDLLTGGGGAVLVAPARREGIVLRKIADEALSMDLLPDINAALAYVQLKEFARNVIIRKEIHDIYIKSVLQSRHKIIAVTDGCVPAVYSFPVVLVSGMKDVMQYATKKDILIEEAFSQSIISLEDRFRETMINAYSFFLRCALFPLYPRLGKANIVKVTKVLSTLP